MFCDRKGCSSPDLNRNVNYISIRFIVIWHLLIKAGLSLLDFQTTMPKTGWTTLGLRGMIGMFPLEEQAIHQTILTWYLQHSGWSAITNSRSRAVMTLNTLHCCRPPVTVWVAKHWGRKSRAMGTLGTALSGPVMSVREIARFNMEASTRQLKASYKPRAVEKS